MGSYFSGVTEEKGVWVNGYHTSQCLPGCIEKFYVEDGEYDCTGALRHSDMLKNIVLFKSAVLHGEKDHPLLMISDLVRYIISLFLEYSVQERLAKAPCLPEPWKLRYCKADGHWDLRLPLSYLYHMDNTPKDTLSNRGKVYHVSPYFWYNDVYASIRCVCPLQRANVGRDKKRYREWKRKMTADWVKPPFPALED